MVMYLKNRTSLKYLLMENNRLWWNCSFLNRSPFIGRKHDWIISAIYIRCSIYLNYKDLISGHCSPLLRHKAHNVHIVSIEASIDITAALVSSTLQYAAKLYMGTLWAKDSCIKINVNQKHKQIIEAYCLHICRFDTKFPRENTHFA